jgi:hypothetical protein
MLQKWGIPCAGLAVGIAAIVWHFMRESLQPRRAVGSGVVGERL